MMKNKKPEIRFKGFSEEWEEKELGQYSKFRRGSFPQPYGNKEWYDGDGAMPFVQVVDVTENLAIADDTKQKISIIAQPKSVFVEKGKIVVTLQGSIGRVAIVQYDVYVDRTLLIFESYEKKTDGYFWAYTIQQKFDIEKLKAPGGTIKTITKEALSTFQISLPFYKEQTQIGNFFKNLDNLISLHQRKYEKLGILKKAMLEKMFPKNGADVPEIRFKGFSGAWESQKLGNLGSVAMNRRIFKDQTSETGDIPFYKIGTFGSKPDAFISRSLFEEYKSKYPYPEKGDILISASGSIGRTVEYLGEDEYFQDSNIVWLKHDDRILNSFLKHFYTIVKWSGLEGSTIKRLYNKSILDTPISLPSPEEQEKIGNYFKNLDNLLTLHQRELEKLQHLKKALLEKMFV